MWQTSTSQTQRSSKQRNQGDWARRLESNLEPYILGVGKQDNCNYIVRTTQQHPRIAAAVLHRQAPLKFWLVNVFQSSEIPFFSLYWNQVISENCFCNAILLHQLNTSMGPHMCLSHSAPSGHKLWAPILSTHLLGCQQCQLPLLLPWLLGKPCSFLSIWAG